MFATSQLVGIVRRLPLLPLAARRDIERHLRARHDISRLKTADFVVVSPPKSGRTWLRVILTRYLQSRHPLPDGFLVGKKKLRPRDHGAPEVFFTHEQLIYDYLERMNAGNGKDDKKIVLLVRHPADVVVSFYFHLVHRTEPTTRFIDDLLIAQTSDLFSFCMSESSGLRGTIGFMNRWAAIARADPNVTVVRYEDLRADTFREIERILRFFGYDPTNEEITEAIDYASFENMQRLETKGAFSSSGPALRAPSSSDPNALKVRRGKVGGYREHFSEGELSEIDKRIAGELDAMFAYGPEP